MASPYCSTSPASAPVAPTSDFRHRAACRDVDPEIFFPVGNSGPALLQIAEAKAVCHTCPVTAECLAWALDTGHEDGVWGGQDVVERAGLQRARRARIRCGAPGPGSAATTGTGSSGVR